MNRPEARNALSGEMLAIMERGLGPGQRATTTIRVAILTGAGGDFCAGADLKAMSTKLAVATGSRAASSTPR